ncbi:MAG: hypothetical protein RIR76_3291 [Verrucomicrobiota bacterium]|jgi:hypothetical protein|nr:hypothetical protein [Opitutaceae bacterium]
MLPFVLRVVATALAVGGVGVWLATGAHRGWTRTSEVEMRRDEITGIDFPVRRDKFTAGVEIPLAALGGAALLTVAAVVLRPRGRSGHANPS